MTAGELMAMLGDVAPETLIVMSKDAEGNAFFPLDEVQSGFYTRLDGWQDGDLWQPDPGETDEDAPAGSVPVLCLWPVN